MRILIATPYMFDEQLNEFSRNKTGFGIIVRDIFKQIQSADEVCLVSHVLTKGQNGIAKHTPASVLFNAGVVDYCGAVRQLFSPDCCDINRINLAYYRLDEGFVRKTIKSFAPDIVHIHGVGPGSNCYIEVCEELRIPYLVTLHGLLEHSSSASAKLKEIERQCLQEIDRKKTPVSVVSTGIKKRLLDQIYYNLSNEDSIHVITNGVDVSRTQPAINIREQYGIPENGKIILSIGSVYPGKNQMQIVRSYAKMQHFNKKNVWIFIIGKVLPEYPIEDEIRELEVQSNIILTGFLPHEELSNYFCEADLVVMASIEEGFGLSMVEGFVYGVPSVTFCDLDAVSDIYDEKAMLLCSERTDEEFAKTMEQALEKKWDSKWIMDYSKKFSAECMLDQYLSLYRKIIEKGENVGR